MKNQTIANTPPDEITTWGAMLEYALPDKLTEEEKQVIRNNVELCFAKLLQKERQRFDKAIITMQENYERVRKDDIRELLEKIGEIEKDACIIGLTEQGQLIIKRVKKLLK